MYAEEVLAAVINISLGAFALVCFAGGVATSYFLPGEPWKWFVTGFLAVNTMILLSLHNQVMLTRIEGKK